MTDIGPAHPDYKGSPQHTMLGTTPVSRLTEVLTDVEANCHVSASPLEEDHSIKDWLDRVSGAGKLAFTACRGGATQSEYEAWVDMAALAARRAAQILEVMQKDNHEHVWPAELEPDSACESCGLIYREWST